MIDRYAVTYRAIESEDYAAIEAMEEKYDFDDSFIAEELSEMFSRPDNDFVKYYGYVAEYGGEVIGYLIEFVPNMTMAAKQTVIVRVAVKEQYRRMGVGTNLIEIVIPTKIGHKANTEIGLEDFVVAAFLRSNGFTVIGVVDAELEEDGEVIMEGYMILQNEKKEKMSLTNRLKWEVK